MVRRQQAADRAIRPKLRSPGHPKFQRHVEAAFWAEIAKGLLPIEAAAVVGVAQAVGQRWFRHAGGMPPFDLKFKPTGRYLSFAEREEIALLKAQDKGVREIARAIGRDPGTVSRELRRNAATRGGTQLAQKTYRADQDLERLTTAAVLNLHLSAVSGREVARIFDHLVTSGLAESSVIRYRASLSSFFGWCVREKLIALNPVTGARVPKGFDERAELNPFTEAELEAAHSIWRGRNKRLADILLVLGWTGLRWGEARAMTVADVMEVPVPGLLIRRSAPEGVGTKATKSGRSRRVPVANRVLPIVAQLEANKQPEDLLFTTDAGSRLHRSAVLRTMKWEQTGQGRRIHDLRHTAACLWLARGVDVGTVQNWMGHASIATTNRYLHFLGTGADLAGLERLNQAPGATGGPRAGGVCE